MKHLSRRQSSTPSTTKHAAAQLPAYSNSADNATAAKDAFNTLWTTHQAGRHAAVRVHSEYKFEGPRLVEKAYVTTGRHSKHRGIPVTDRMAKGQGHELYNRVAWRIARCYEGKPGCEKIAEAAEELLVELKRTKEVRKDDAQMHAAILKLHEALNAVQGSDDEQSVDPSTHSGFESPETTVLVASIHIDPDSQSDVPEPQAKPAPNVQQLNTPPSDLLGLAKITYSTSYDRAAQKTAGQMPIHQPGAVTNMLDALKLLASEGQLPGNLHIDPSTKVVSAKRGPQQQADVGHREAAVRLEALGLMYADFPEQEVRAAAERLISAAHNALREGTAVHAGDEVIAAFDLINSRCAEKMFEPAVNAFYQRQAARYASTDGPITLARLQSFTFQQWSDTTQQSHEQCDQYGAMNMFKYLHGRQYFGVEDHSPVFFNVMPGGETRISNKIAKQAPTQFDDGEPLLVTIAKHDPAKLAAEAIQRYGKRYINHPDERVAKAAALCLATAEPVLQSHNTPSTHIVGTPELADAFATIALYGHPIAAADH